MTNRNKILNLSKRIMLLVVSFFILAFAVALSARANLGVSPISSAVYAFSEYFPLTMGQMTIVVHTIFILIQILLLRKNFKPFQLTQLLAAFIFGFFIDFAMWATEWISVSNYAEQWLLCSLSCIIVGFGVLLEIKANLLMLAAEGLTIAIAQVTHIEFGKVKLFVDGSQMLIGVIFSLIVFQELVGVREGTVAAALLVGNIVRFFDKHIHFVDAFLEEKVEPVVTGETAI